MNNTVNSQSEEFGEFMSAKPSIFNQPVYNNNTYIINNNILYQKLIEVQNEMKEIKNLLQNLQPKPLNNNYYFKDYYIGKPN